MEEEKKDLQEQLVYNPKEISYLNYLVTRIQHSRDLRNAPHWQFDNMTYPDWYKSNAKAAVGFKAPRANPTDTEVTTALTSQKVKTLVNILMGFNYSIDITSVNKDSRIQVEMGNCMEELVKQTKRNESDNLKKKSLRFKEMIEQGDVFVEEYFKESQKMSKTPKGKFTGSMKFEWTEKLEDVLGQAETKIIPGLNFYPGDVTSPDMEEQPFVFTASTMSYAQAEKMYGKWDRFKFVPKDLVTFSDTLYYGSIISLEKETKERVEMVKYFDKWANEFMIMLNGVMMMPIKFPLTMVSPSGDYPVANGSLYPRKDFFYSKSLAADTKTLQEIVDAAFMGMVWKQQYSSRPSVVNNSGRKLPSSVYQGGIIMENIQNPELIVPLFPSIQITEADFNYFQLVNQLVEKNSFSSIIEGLGGTGDTATQSIQQQRNSMKKLGNVIDAAVAVETKLYWLRIYNIIKNYTDNDKIKKVFRKIITRTKKDGKDGYKIYSFDEEKAKQDPLLTKVEAGIVSNENLGKGVEMIYIDPKLYKESINNIWIVNVIAESSTVSELQKAQLLELVRVVATFAPQQMNTDYILTRIIALSGEDPSKWLKTQNQAMPQEQLAAQAEARPTGTIEKQLKQGVGNQAKAPSINTLMGQV